MHIRIYQIPACCHLKRLPPTQTRGIPDFQGKTPVAQMHFASELPLASLVMIEGTRRNQFYFQITHNSAMGLIHKYKVNILGETPVDCHFLPMAELCYHSLLLLY
jgi:hypothetical protein